MKHVLFAADTLRPQREVFEHTVQMCVEMASRLHVLQIINPGRCRQLLAATQTKLERFQQMVETSLSAATYAQAGSQELARECLLQGGHGLDALRPLAEKAGVVMDSTQLLGVPEQELTNFLTDRTDIVMAVFDARDTLSRRASSKKLRQLRKVIPYQLGIPLIIPNWGQRIKEAKNETLG